MLKMKSGNWVQIPAESVCIHFTLMSIGKELIHFFPKLHVKRMPVKSFLFCLYMIIFILSTKECLIPVPLLQLTSCIWAWHSKKARWAKSQRFQLGYDTTNWKGQNIPKGQHSQWTRIFLTLPMHINIGYFIKLAMYSIRNNCIIFILFLL